MSEKNTASILVVGHASGRLGGVGNYLRTLVERSPAELDLELFVNGPRKNEDGLVQKFSRLFLDYVRFLTKLFKGHDLIHLNPTLDNRSLFRESIFMLICLLFNKKYIIFFRGWEWPSFNENYLGTSLKAKYIQYITRKSECIVVLAQSFKAAMQDVFPDAKICLTTTMFDGADMPDKSEKDFAKLTILFMSRFIAAKGGKQAIEAFGRISKQQPDWSLVMAGDGPTREEWEKQALSLTCGADRIHFLGYISKEGKKEALQNCNVFLMPSDHPEGLPNALMEAMGAGLLPVITDVGGVSQAIEGGRLGVLLENSSVDEIVKSLLHVHKNKAESSKMAIDARARAWEQYEANVVCNNIFDIYSRCVSCNEQAI